MIMLGIDPGPRDSGLTWWDTDAEKVRESREDLNDNILRELRDNPIPMCAAAMIIIEDPQPMRRPASEDFIDTCKWSGRFREAIEGGLDLATIGSLIMIPYREVSQHFCRIVGAKETFVKRAIIEKYGDPGTKSKPGKLYGTKGHGWSALAVCIVASERLKRR